MKVKYFLITLLLLANFIFVRPICAQTTSFNYQGQLTVSGIPANGNFDMQFKLFDALTGGNQQGTTITYQVVAVNNGIFSVTLDFGANVFSGAIRYLEISVRQNIVPYTVITPRQPITSSPYAIRTLFAASADSLTEACVGCVTNNQVQSLDGAKLTGTIPVSTVPTGSGNYIQNTTSLQTNSNFNISGNGLIGGTLGIGLTNPFGQLHIKGASPVRIFGDTTTLSGTEYVDFFARSSLFSSDLGGMRIQRQTNGNIDTLFFASQSGFAASEKMRIGGNGALSVSGGGTFTGLNGDGAVLTARRTSGDSYFIVDSPETQNSILALRKNNFNRWLMFADNVNSDLRLDAYNDVGNGLGTRLFVNRQNGNVGIGNTNPGYKLDVSGIMRMRQDISGDSGIWFNRNAGGDRLFVGMRDDNYLGLYADLPNHIVMNTVNGNVGIGTYSPPRAKLEVNGDTVQPRNSGGMVKAMAFIDPFINPGTNNKIVRCYNSQATGAEMTTPPCGFNFTYQALGRYDINFGFFVNDRFIVLTPVFYEIVGSNPFRVSPMVFGTGGNSATVIMGYSDDSTVYGGTDCRFYIVVY